jgi:hypothetical protein
MVRFYKGQMRLEVKIRGRALALHAQDPGFDLQHHEK